MKIKSTAVVTAAALAASLTFTVSASGTASEYAEKIRIINDTAQTYGTDNIAFDYCEEPLEKGTKQTIFIFMIGSDMSAYAGYDICEMLGSGYQDPETNVILIAGGSKKWNINALNDNPVSVYKLSKNGFVSLHETDNYNIFDTDDIYSLMFRYMARYRAESYSVFFWDHGGGFVNGFGKDETNVNGSISTEKLARVFQDIREDAARDYGIVYNYDVAGFDACLMADVQTADRFAEAGFRYFLGSEDVESFYGWNYAFLGSDALSEGGSGLCRAVIDQTAEFNQEHSVNSYTISCIDLSKTGNIIASLEGVSDQLLAHNNEERYLNARYNTRTYGNSGTGSRFDSGSHDYVDIGSYAENIRGAGEDTSALKSAVDAAVVYNRSSEDACGLSVYSYYSSSKNSLNSWCRLTGDELNQYKALQRKAESSINGNAVSDGAAVESGVIENSGSRYTYTMNEKEAADVCDAVFCVYQYDDGIFRNAAVVHDVTIGENMVSVDYDNTCVYMLNDSERYLCSLDLNNGKKRIGIKKDKGKNAYAADFGSYHITLSEEGSVLGVASADAEALAAKENAVLENGDRIYIRADEYTEDNYPVHSVPDIFTVHDSKFSFEKLEGEFYGRFEIINPYGYVQYYSPAVKIDCTAERETGVADEANTGRPELTNEILVGGTALRVPCSAAELEAAGYRFSSKLPVLGAGEECLGSMRGDNAVIDVKIHNFRADSVGADQGTIIGITSPNCEYGGLRTGMYFDGSGADSAYQTGGEAKYLYKLNDSAVIPDFERGDLAANGLYSGAAHDYASVSTDKRSGRLISISVNSIEGCVPDGAENGTYDYEYRAPVSLGYDPYSFVLELEGELYALPVPVSELFAKGWTMHCERDSIPSMGMAEAELEKNGKMFRAELVNYGVSPARAEDCIACGIFLDFTDLRTADAVLSGGIDLAGAAESIMAGRYQDVYNQANKFMRYNGGMVYASGNFLDYDGEIEISSESVYLYRRYDGIRSMSGFDRLVKYFVY